MSEDPAVPEDHEQDWEQESLPQDSLQKQMLAVAVVTLAATLVVIWFAINILFDRWSVKGGGFAPFLPYPTAPGPSYNYQHWLGLFTMYALIGVPIAAITIAEVFFMAWKYRDRPGRKDPEEKIYEDRIPRSDRGNKRSLLYVNIFVAIILFSLTAYSLPLNGTLLGPPPPAAPGDPPVVVIVTGHQWYWEFEYPNNKTVDAASGSQTMLPINTEIIFKVTSDDVLHDFSIPSLAVNVNAYPGNYNTAWTEIYDNGNYTAFCVELCGIGHADMYATIEAVSPVEFEAWCGPNCTSS